MDPTSGALAAIGQLGLDRHPEGGWFREVHRSARAVDPLDGRGRRAALTMIHYLLARGEASRWHRISSDEAWHHHDGDALELYLLDPGLHRLEHVRLGRSLDGARPACVVPAGWWQAARTLGEWTLLTCTVGPGFDFTDFELMLCRVRERNALLASFPRLAELL